MITCDGQRVSSLTLTSVDVDDGSYYFRFANFEFILFFDNYRRKLFNTRQNRASNFILSR